MAEGRSGANSALAALQSFRLRGLGRGDDDIWMQRVLARRDRHGHRPIRGPLFESGTEPGAAKGAGRADVGGVHRAATEWKQWARSLTGGAGRLAMLRNKPMTRPSMVSLARLTSGFPKTISKALRPARIQVGDRNPFTWAPATVTPVSVTTMCISGRAGLVRIAAAGVRESPGEWAWRGRGANRARVVHRRGLGFGPWP